MPESADGDFASAPPAVAQVVRRHLASGQPAPVPAQLATTVVLLRDRHPPRTGVEAFLLERAATMVFAPRQTVFPGGRVDPADARSGADPGVGDLQRWAELGEPTASLWTLLRCAVRELFEETGVLLAAPAPGARTVTEQQRREARGALLARHVGLDEVLGALGARLDATLLAPLTRWITPEWSPHRYDTFFFVAVLPPDQDPQSDGGGESVSSAWRTPREALGMVEAGRASMLTPTSQVLRELSRCADTETALAHRMDPGPHTFELEEGPDAAQIWGCSPRGRQPLFRVPR